MLPNIRDYDQLYREFRWPQLAHYNIGVDVCDKWAGVDPDRLAILNIRADGKTENISFGWLREMSNRLANTLAVHGVARGDRVAMLLPQTPEAAVGHIAIYKLGAIAVPLAILFGVDALSYRLQNAGVKAVITNAQGLAKLNQIRGELPELFVLSIDGPGEGALGLSETIARASDRIHAGGHDAGRSGADDLHLRHHRPGERRAAWASRAARPFARRGDAARVFPASRATGSGRRPTGPGPAGCSIACCRACITACRWWRAGSRNSIPRKPSRCLRRRRCATPSSRRPRCACCAPRPRRRAATISRLRTLGSGGESLGAETYEWGRDAFGLTINEFYGQTECNLVLSSCAVIGVSKPGAIGKPVPGHDVAVIREDGTRADAGELGMIAVKRPDPVMFLEYWGRPEATREKFIGDWMTTGDQGVVDDEGYITFVGRDDDVITSSGYRIGPGEIEDCLIKHPAVALAAVVGKPDAVRTEIVKAFIVLKSGFEASDALAGEMRDFVRTRLSAHEYPREVAFITEMPMTTTGKVIRRLLRERA